ncbi:putative HTH-type transcriptional regulator YusO [Clostridium tepidiprofundi DSM 19306]|uniref:Putative HTH-type transcriptional regulator YusO n=1 Tax=Clostridium tepidiprofundi DSM 19306 TaxID=1121338 RepID=A0A151B6C8_9CLOT|nr:MarR family transcriptional regulator [Clostridium tepidiprofundi]KYH35353.1 putative HTH-type transcriptional regulator YusO [Clostridium tepidiprofundi DSM 19306]
MNTKQSDKNASIELLLRKLCFIIKQNGRELLSDFNMTPPQFNALQIIISEGEITISELSNKLYLAPSTITDIIDRMEKNNLVKRTRDTKDRRVVNVKAVEKGHSLINDVIKKRVDFIKKHSSELSIEDKENLIKYLSSIINSYNK